MTEPAIREKLKKHIYVTDNFTYDFEKETYQHNNNDYYGFAVHDNPLSNYSNLYENIELMRIENLNKIIKSESTYDDILYRKKHIGKEKYNYDYLKTIKSDIDVLDKLTKKKERVEYIKNKFLFIEEFVLSDSQFNLINNVISIDTFYSYIKEIITNFNVPDANFTDNVQESSSCAFFSTYYTLKFFFFSDDSLFNIFINKIKLDLLTHLKTTLALSYEKNPDINLVNTGLLLIKDYSENEVFVNIAFEIKEILSNLFQNDFTKIKDNSAIVRNNDRLEIYHIFKKREYEKYVENINFNTYLNFITEMSFIEIFEENTNIKYILFFYMFYKASILFLDSLKEERITTREEFIEFHSKLTRLCGILRKIEISNSDTFNLIIPNIKLKFLSKFLKMLKNFDLINLNDTSSNIFHEPQIINNKHKIWEFIYNGYINIYDYDIDFNELFEDLTQKYDLLVIENYFDVSQNRGEFFYLLGFSEKLTIYNEFVKEQTQEHLRWREYEDNDDFGYKKYIKLGEKNFQNNPNQSGGGYGFDFVKYYNGFLKNYDVSGSDNNNDLSYDNIKEKIINKKYINFSSRNLGKKLNYDNDDLVQLNKFIDGINSSDKKVILDNKHFLVYNQQIQIDFLSHDSSEFNALYYKKIYHAYYGLKKSANTNTKIILPSLIQKLDINKFVENMSLMSENCIDTIAFLIHKYRRTDYDTYRIDNLLSDTSLFKIISADNEQLYKIFFYNFRVSGYRAINYSKEITVFNNNKNKVCDYQKNSVLFVYSVLEYIGYKNINDSALFDHVQQVFNEYSTKSKIVGNYILLDAKNFNYNMMIYRDTTTNKTYYKTDKQTNMCLFDIVNNGEFSPEFQQRFASIKYKLFKYDTYIKLPDKLQIFIENISAVSINFLWKNIHGSGALWLLELIDFDKIIRFVYNQDSDTFSFYDDDNRYTVVTEYNKIMGMLVFNSPNMLVLSKNNKHYVLLLNSVEYYKNILSKNNFYWINNSHFNPPDKSNFQILEINHNLLTFNIKNNQYFDLMYSFVFNKNNYGIFLIMDNYKNIINNVKDRPNIYFDVPFARLYNNKILKTNTLNKNFNYQDIPTSPSKKFVIELDDYNLSNISIINTISDKINFIKNIQHGEIKQKIIDKKDEIKLYIDDYRANCKNEYSELKDYIAKITLIPNQNMLTYLDTLFDEITCKKIIHSFPSLYVNKYNLFYNIIVSCLYNICIDELRKLSIFSCEQLLKKIVLLDHCEIYPVDEIRNIEDILFEIHTNFFIKQEQKNLATNNILEDLRSNVNDKVYEILMGKGKTTTITPLILINQIFTTCVKNYNIVLPKHLVPSSLDIITNYSQIFYNYNINNGIQLNMKYDYTISIISDVLLKEFILKKITKLEKIETLFNSNNLFIFDEIDTLIDSNKSELNMPTGDYSHQYSNFIFNNIINIVVDYYEKTDTNFDKLIRTTEIDTKIIMYFKEKMSKIFEIVETMIYNQTYGFAKLKYENIAEIEKEKSNFIAVPYSANNTPINESEFTDFELAITLTILSYMNNGLRPEDLFIVFRKFQKILAKDINFKMFLPDFITNIMINDIIKISTFRDEEFLEWCNLKINVYAKNKNLIIYYLNEIILRKYFTISNEQYNISMVDLLDCNICKKKILFSGTVNFYLLSDISKNVIQNYTDFKTNYPQFDQSLLSEIIPDVKSKGSIYSAIYGITTKLTKIVQYEGSNDYLKMENNFIDFILNVDNLNIFDAIIDAAGLIINKTSTFVINLIYQQIKSNKINKTLLFVNEFDDKMIYYSPDNIQKYNNELFENLLIYYDHKHTIGIDFKQPAKMQGIVTVSKSNTLTQISQAIFRLRNINMGHSIDFYSDNRIFNMDEITIDTLLTNFIVNETHYKNGTKNSLQIQFLKFLNRFINKNTETYKEKIFYDLIEFDGKFLSQQQFINNVIIKNIIDSIKTNNIFIKSLDYKYSPDKIATNIQLKKQIEIDININININISSRKKWIDQLYFFSKLNDEYIAFNEISNNNNFFYSDYPPRKLSFINVGEWTINFSPMIYHSFKNAIILTNNDLYFLYDPRIPQKITIIHYIDYLTMIKEYTYSSRFYTDVHLREQYGIFIYDNSGNIVWNVVSIPEISHVIPSYIQVLLFNLNISYIDTFYYLSTLKQYIDFDKYSFLRGNLGITPNYSLFVKPTHSDVTSLIDLLDDYSNFLTWKKIFDLPELTPEQQQMFEDQIIKKYIDKYISPAIKYSDDTSKIIGSTFTNIIEQPIKIDKVIVEDSMDRVQLNSKGYKDNETVLLYDNDKFRKNKLATFKAYPENIHIFRNGLNLKGSYRVKQKILNILSYRGFTNIKLTDFTTNSLIFEVKGNKNKYIINFNIGDEYREKYLKYKQKYLNLKRKHSLHNMKK